MRCDVSVLSRRHAFGRNVTVFRSKSMSDGPDGADLVPARLELRDPVTKDDVGSVGALLEQPQLPFAGDDLILESGDGCPKT